MYLILGVVISLVVWLITFGIFDTLPIVSQTQYTYLSQSKHNNTVIFIVLDAFRYDYSHRFSFFNKLTQEQPNNTILLKMLSSAPTMTTQKIQVMMSGHEMASKNIIENFMVRYTKQDNILNYVNTISMGDDTWGKMYNISKHIDCQSFVVSDLHSCDKIYKDGNYNMVIGHFLGLDHIGHTFSSVSTAQTTYKLNQISAFLNKIVEEMDNKTTLIVLGDHGMKSDGNHGGSSKQQIQTVFFAYSKTPLMKQEPRQVCFQNDVTATLSILLNTPLPVNSLGSIIYSALPKSININISQTTTILQNHIRKVLTRIGKSFDQGNQIFSARQVTTQIKSYFLLFVILLLGITIGTILKKLNLSFVQLTLIFIYPISNFSWFMLRHQQTYLQVILIVFFLILTIKFQKTGIFIDSIVTIFLLCQFEYHRKDQFNNSVFHLDFLSNFLQNSYVLLIIKIGLFLTTTYPQFKSLSYLQKVSRVFIFINIVMYEVNEELLCLTKTIQVSLLVIMLIIKKDNKLNTIQSLIFVFSGKKGLVMFALSDGVKDNLKLNQTVSPYLNYLISQTMWLGKGNRADFSSIDIKSSYIFTTQFIPFLNFSCLILHQMCSYLHFLKQIPMKLTVKHLLTQQQQENQKEGVSVLQGLNQHLKYLLIPLISVLFSLICLYLNIGKILFTVAYIPLCFFCILKLASLYFFIITRLVFSKYKILEQ